MPRIGFYTLGCKVNQADTASMEQLFAKAGYSIVPFTDPADVYLINTCVVTNMGQSKSRKIIHRAVRNNPEPW
jgi:threonylcarbamoyladenosine tRNA methylthiotransferase MtaB